MKAADIQFCAALIGKPWVSGAAGPDAFDCWGLLRYVLRERRGIEIASYAGVKETGLAAMVRTASIECSNKWEHILTPEHFCGVAISRGRAIEHVGIWLDEGNGGILHCYESFGVVFQTTNTIRATGFQNFTFYKLKP